MCFSSRGSLSRSSPLLRALLSPALDDPLHGRHHRRDDVELRPITRVDLLAPPNVLLQLDGDVSEARPPVTIDLAPRRLEVLGPIRVDVR